MSSAYWLGLVGAVFTLVLVFEMLRRRRLREKYAVLWVALSLVIVLVALVPGILSTAARLVGVQVPANLLFFLSSLVLLGINIHLSYEAGRLEEKTRTLAEEVAELFVQVQELREQRDGEDRAPRPAATGPVEAADPVALEPSQRR